MVLTVNDAYLDLRNELRLRGISGFQIEARELVCHALDIDPQQFHTKKYSMIFEKQMEEIHRLRDLRLSGVPVQHITGRWEFYGLPLFVTTDTLIPRADTETLVECGIDFLKSREKGRVLDLCCGTGCVGMAVLKNVSDGITGVFADLSEEVLQVTRKNLMHNHLTPRALTIQVNVMEQPAEALGKYHLILCNPPYIPTAEIATLDIEVQREPRMALDGGEDGLDFYRAVSRNYQPLLARGGALMFEVGLGQYQQVMDILTACGYGNVHYVCDLAGVERVVVATME